MVVALCAAAAFGIFTWWFLRRSPRGARRRAILAAVILPPVCVASGFVGFGVYALWCETIRGVDAGIGDSWRVPLGSGYELQMIDVPEQVFVRTPTGGQRAFGFRRVGYSDKFIYLETESDKYQLIDKSTGNSLENLSLDGLNAKLSEAGASPAILRSPAEAYSSLRWGVLDVVAALMILVPSALLTLMVLVYVVWVRRQGRMGV